MNFNFNAAPEYTLNTNMIKEVINLYGVLVKLLITTRINKDDNVFGDYSHLKSDSNKIYDIHMLPEVSEDWDNGEFAFNPFGLVNTESVNLFVSTTDLTTAGVTDSMLGSLVVMPNNKIMEITNLSYEQPGINNLFVYPDAKSVAKLTCKPYDYKLINEIDNVDASVDPLVPYDTLDNYFAELIDQTTQQNTGAEVTPSVETIVKTGTVDTRVQKPIIDKTEDDVFGNF